MDLQPLELTYYIILTCQTLVIRTLKLGILTLNIVLTVLLTYCMIGCFPDSYLNKKLFHQGYTIHLFVSQCLFIKFPFIKESKLNNISIHGLGLVKSTLEFIDVRFLKARLEFTVVTLNLVIVYALCFYKKGKVVVFVRQKGPFLMGFRRPQKSPQYQRTILLWPLLVAGHNCH